MFRNLTVTSAIAVGMYFETALNGRDSGRSRACSGSRVLDTTGCDALIRGAGTEIEPDIVCIEEVVNCTSSFHTDTVYITVERTRYLACQCGVRFDESII